MTPSFDELMSMSPAQRATVRQQIDEKRGQRTAAGAGGGDEKPVTREQVGEIIKRRARKAHPDLNEEVAIAKFARTPEGRGFRAVYDNLAPDDEPDPRPVRKVGPGGTGEIAKAARKIAAERGISEEASYAHLPTELLEQHRNEL